MRGRPLRDRTREHDLDIHERWFAPLHSRRLTSITGLDVDRWYNELLGNLGNAFNPLAGRGAGVNGLVSRDAASSRPPGFR